MLLRRGLVFAGLVVGHYAASWLACFFCYALYMQWPAPAVFSVFFFPALLSYETGAGVVPAGDDSLTNIPWAMEVNSLLWVAAVYSAWLLLRLAVSKGRTGSPADS